MTYNAQRYEALLRLGIEQLPPLTACSSNDSNASASGNLPIVALPEDSPLPVHMAIRECPVPGRKCPSCLSRGQIIWVIPGKLCPQCGTEVI